MRKHKKLSYYIKYLEIFLILILKVCTSLFPVSLLLFWVISWITSNNSKLFICPFRIFCNCIILTGKLLLTSQENLKDSSMVNRRNCQPSTIYSSWLKSTQLFSISDVQTKMLGFVLCFFYFPKTVFSSVQLSLSHVWLFVTLWIKSVMPSSHLIPCSPLLLLPPIPPSIRVFSNESTLHMRWPKDWSFSFSISPSSEHPVLISFRRDWLESKGLSRVFSNTIVQKHQFFGAQLSSQSNYHIHTWPLEKP